MLKQRIGPRLEWNRLLRATALSLVLAWAGCAEFGWRAADAQEIPDSVEGLTAAIQAEREALTDLLSQPSEDDQEDEADQFGKIGKRLATLQDALSVLQPDISQRTRSGRSSR